MQFKKKKNRFFKPSLLLLEDRLTPTAYGQTNLIEANPLTKTLDVTYTAQVSTQIIETYINNIATPVSTTGAFNYGVNFSPNVDGFSYSQNNIKSGGTSITTGATSSSQVTSTVPTLRVNRGDTLRITLNNSLVNLDNLGIGLISEDSTKNGMPISFMPLSNHTHGLHISPRGSSDNVLVNIPDNQGFVYEYKISQNQPDGLYWYHPHNHGYSSEQIYRGLAGLLIIGQGDSSITQVQGLPELNMVIQYQNLAPVNSKSATDVGAYQFIANNPSTPSSATATASITNGVVTGLVITNGGSGYSTAPTVIFKPPTVGTTATATAVLTNGVVTGLVITNGGSGYSTATTVTITATGNAQLTVNGQLNPIITTLENQSFVFNLANMTNRLTTLNINLETYVISTGVSVTQLPINIIAQDGAPYSTVRNIPAGITGGFNIAVGGRYSIIVQSPTTAQRMAGLGVRMVITDTSSGDVQPNRYGVSLIGNGTSGSSFVIPTTLTVPSTTFSAFVDLSQLPSSAIAETRTKIFSFAASDASAITSNGSFINGAGFPNNTLSQPRVNTTEEWILENYSGATHPFHYHVNDFQVMSVFDPTPSTPAGQGTPAYANLTVTTPNMWYQDTINLPAASFNSDGTVNAPGRVVLRTKSLEFAGAFVFHCHILDHEDSGMMSLNTIIPAIPIYVAAAGPGGGPAVSVYNSLNNNNIATIFAFEKGFTGGVQTAVADVNNDSISDLIVGAGPGGGPRVQVFNGATNFTTTLFDFFAFDTAFRGGTFVAGGDFNSDGFDDIVVGAGSGGGPEVRIFDGRTGNVITQFFAYDQSFRGGVTVAVGDIDGSGFESLVTGAGAGGGSHVKSFRNSRFFMIGDTPVLPGNQSIFMNQTGQFMAYETGYTGGVQVAVGLNAGGVGNFYRILTGTLTAGPRVTIWENTFIHDDGSMATAMVNFTMVSDFFAFDSTQTTGVRVGSVVVSTGSDFLAATGSGTSTVMKRFSLLPGSSEPTLLDEFNPFTSLFSGGANIGGTN